MRTAGLAIHVKVLKVWERFVGLNQLECVMTPIGQKSRVAITVVCLLCLLAVVGCSVGHADREHSLHSEQLSFRLSKCDLDSAVLDELVSEGASQVFLEEEQTWLETGYGCPAIWLAFGSIERAGVIDFGTLVDKVTLYILNSQNGELVWTSEAGDQLAANNGDLQAVHIAFPIDKQFLANEIYAKIEHPSQLRIEPRFLERQEFERRERDALVVHSLVIGAAAVIALFNLLLGLALRKSLFIYYALFVASLMVANMTYTGLGAAYFWPAYAQTSNFVREIAIVCNLVFAGAMFTVFLEDCDAKQIIRYGILYPAISIIPVSVVWWLFDEWIAHMIISAWAGLAILAFVATVSLLTLRRYASPRLLLLPLFLICLPVFLALFVPKNSPTELEIGLLSVRYILPVDHYFEAVMLLDALLFSLLFAFRIRIVESEALRVSDEMRTLQQSISQRIINTIDGERRRIAADLHDTAGQGLLAIATRLTHFSRDNSLSSKQKAEVQQTADYSRGVVNDIRRISHDLHPAILDHIGWGAAIEEMYENLSQHSDIDAQVDIQVDDDVLNDSQRMHLFRITQEIVSNAAKHSSSTKHRARFYLEDQRLNAEFAEDTKFEIARTSERNSHSLGYSIIDQRVRSLNGKWHKTSQNGQTTIAVEIPVFGDNQESPS